MINKKPNTRSLIRYPSKQVESNYTFAFMLLEPLRLVRMSRMMAAFASTRLPLGVMTSHQPQI